MFQNAFPYVLKSVCIHLQFANLVKICTFLWIDCFFHPSPCDSISMRFQSKLEYHQRYTRERRVKNQLITLIRKQSGQSICELYSLIHVPLILFGKKKLYTFNWVFSCWFWQSLKHWKSQRRIYFKWFHIWILCTLLTLYFFYVNVFFCVLLLFLRIHIIRRI